MVIINVYWYYIRNALNKCLRALFGADCGGREEVLKIIEFIVQYFVLSML